MATFDFQDICHVAQLFIRAGNSAWIGPSCFYSWSSHVSAVTQPRIGLSGAKPCLRGVTQKTFSFSLVDPSPALMETLYGDTGRGEGIWICVDLGGANAPVLARVLIGSMESEMKDGGIILRVESLVVEEKRLSRLEFEAMQLAKEVDVLI